MARKPKPQPTEQELLDELEITLTLWTVSVVKQIAKLRGESFGKLACPRCRVGTLTFSLAQSNGHIAAKCSTKDCVSAVE